MFIKKTYQGGVPLTSIKSKVLMMMRECPLAKNNWDEVFSEIAHLNPGLGSFKYANFYTDIDNPKGREKMDEKAIENEIINICHNPKEAAAAVLKDKNALFYLSGCSPDSTPQSCFQSNQERIDQLCQIKKSFSRRSIQVNYTHSILPELRFLPHQNEDLGFLQLFKNNIQQSFQCLQEKRQSKQIDRKIRKLHNSTKVNALLHSLKNFDQQTKLRTIRNLSQLKEGDFLEIMGGIGSVYKSADDIAEVIDQNAFDANIDRIFKDVARTHEVPIVIRIPTEPSKRHQQNGFSTKSQEIKNKSSTLRGIEGFIPCSGLAGKVGDKLRSAEEAIFLINEEIAKLNKQKKLPKLSIGLETFYERVKKLSDELGLKIVEENKIKRNNEFRLDRLRNSSKVVVRNRGSVDEQMAFEERKKSELDKLAKALEKFTTKRNYLEKAVQTEDEMIGQLIGNHKYKCVPIIRKENIVQTVATYFDRKKNHIKWMSFSSDQLKEEDPLSQSSLIAFVLADHTGNPITADTDLFLIGVREHEIKVTNGKETYSVHYDPDLGFRTELADQVRQDANERWQGLTFNTNIIVRHGDEVNFGLNPWDDIFKFFSKLGSKSKAYDLQQTYDSFSEDHRKNEKARLAIDLAQESLKAEGTVHIPIPSRETQDTRAEYVRKNFGIEFNVQSVFEEYQDLAKQIQEHAGEADSRTWRINY